MDITFDNYQYVDKDDVFFAEEVIDMVEYSCSEFTDENKYIIRCKLIKKMDELRKTCLTKS